MTYIIKIKLLTLSILVFSSFTLSAQDAQKTKEHETFILETLLNAVQENDLEKFTSVCDQKMIEAIDQSKLKQIHDQLAKLMKQGYQKKYLAVLNRGEYKTYLWKINLSKNGAPDMLAELSIAKDKVAGFMIR